jgi:hypothetical protein
MNNFGLLSLSHIISLLAVNSLGILAIGVIIYYTFRKTEKTKAKLTISVGVAIASLILWAVICGNIGLYLWVKTANIRAVLVSIPLVLCGAPALFLIVTIGTYLQLIYRDKIREYTNSLIKKQS